MDLVDEQHRPRPDCSRASSARATASRISLTPARTAEIATNSASKASAISRASVVLPMPGGPHRIIECGLPASKARRSGLPGCEQMRLTDDLVERARTQALGERRQPVPRRIWLRKEIGHGGDARISAAGKRCGRGFVAVSRLRREAGDHRPHDIGAFGGVNRNASAAMRIAPRPLNVSSVERPNASSAPSGAAGCRQPSRIRVNATPPDLQALHRCTGVHRPSPVAKHEAMKFFSSALSPASMPRACGTERGVELRRRPGSGRDCKPRPF